MNTLVSILFTRKATALLITALAVAAGYSALGGNSWNSAGGGAMMSIQASAIPEPSTYAAIAGAAMLGLAVWQRSRKTTVAVAPCAPSAA